LAAYVFDHDPISYRTLIAPAFVDGNEGGLTRDDILDNVTLFWLTNTGVSSGRLHWEYNGSFADARNVTIPVAVSVFPDENFQAPRSWAEKAYSNLVHYNAVDRGGHFAIWEQPELYASELRAGFRSLR
jgi:pimeloyl-ACP methyl ester carboxylesterase